MELFCISFICSLDAVFGLIGVNCFVIGFLKILCHYLLEADVVLAKMEQMIVPAPLTLLYAAPYAVWTLMCAKKAFKGVYIIILLSISSIVCC